MNITTVIVAIVVLLAVVYLGRHIRGLFKGTTSCCSSCGGGCSCSTTKESKKMSMKANFHRAAVLKAKLSHRVNAL